MEENQVEGFTIPPKVLQGVTSELRPAPEPERVPCTEKGAAHLRTGPFGLWLKANRDSRPPVGGKECEATPPPSHIEDSGPIEDRVREELGEVEPEVVTARVHAGVLACPEEVRVAGEVLAHV